MFSLVWSSHCPTRVLWLICPSLLLHLTLYTVHSCLPAQFPSQHQQSLSALLGFNLSGTGLSEPLTPEQQHQVRTSMEGGRRGREAGRRGEAACGQRLLWLAASWAVSLLLNQADGGRGPEAAG